MTQFIKDKFSYHGGYLMYHGTYEGQPTYDEAYGKDKIHPSRIGMPVELFIARFKYSGPFTKAKFLKELLKSGLTVEQYVEARKTKAPLEVLEDNNPSWYETVLTNWRMKHGG